jgi:hypothetical protein
MLILIFLRYVDGRAAAGWSKIAFGKFVERDPACADTVLAAVISYEEVRPMNGVWVLPPMFTVGRLD